MSSSFEFIKETMIASQYHGQRVDVVLAQLFPDYSRSQLTHWLKEGAILINQRTAKPKEKIFGGEHVKIQVILNTQSEKNHAEPIPIEVVFEDDFLLVINKQAGLIVHPGAGNPNHTLVNALLYHEPSLQHLPRAGIVHRLDKDTTGLLMVAKTPTVHTHLIRQMQAHDIQRHYVTLVHGHVISSGTLDTCYGRHPRHRLKMAVCPHGKQAITHFSVNKHYPHLTLLNVRLMTGRTHQIRVHMAHIHHPVVGDALYGGQARFPAGLSATTRQLVQSFKRQALHASELSFTHPHSQERLTCTAPLPNDFKLLLSTLDAEIV